MFDNAVLGRLGEENIINQSTCCSYLGASKHTGLTFRNLHFHILIVNVADPDLTITVDLEREEQERNGRRKYNLSQ